MMNIYEDSVQTSHVLSSDGQPVLLAIRHCSNALVDASGPGGICEKFSI